MTIRVLSVRPNVKSYDSTQRRDLQRDLAEVQRATRVQTATDVKELQLDAQGYLNPGGARRQIRFTTMAFKRFCDLLSPGLFTLLDNLSGQVQQRGEAQSAYSFAEAVAIYNTVLARRYATRVSNRVSFIWNTKEKLLEGAYGARYRHLANADIFELAEATSTAGSSPMAFGGALLSGRRLLMRYKQRVPIAAVTLPSGAIHHYSGGIYFHNSELGGETSVRLATLLCRADCDFSCMTSFDGTRLSHAGRDFRTRVRSTVARLILRLDDLRNMRANLQTMARTPLGLTTSSTGSVGVRKLTRYLRSLGLTAGATRATIHGVMYYGSDTEPQLGTESLIENRAIASRTLYDLFTALMREARRYSVNSREVLEQAAYAVLQHPEDIG